MNTVFKTVLVLVTMPYLATAQVVNAAQQTVLGQQDDTFLAAKNAEQVQQAQGLNLGQQAKEQANVASNLQKQANTQELINAGSQLSANEGFQRADQLDIKDYNTINGNHIAQDTNSVALSFKNAGSSRVGDQISVDSGSAVNYADQTQANANLLGNDFANAQFLDNFAIADQNVFGINAAHNNFANIFDKFQGQSFQQLSAADGSNGFFQDFNNGVVFGAPVIGGFGGLGGGLGGGFGGGLGGGVGGGLGGGVGGGLGRGGVKYRR